MYKSGARSDQRKGYLNACYKLLLRAFWARILECNKNRTLLSWRQCQNHLACLADSRWTYRLLIQSYQFIKAGYRVFYSTITSRQFIFMNLSERMCLFHYSMCVLCFWKGIFDWQRSAIQHVIFVSCLTYSVSPVLASRLIVGVAVQLDGFSINLKTSSISQGVHK